MRYRNLDLEAFDYRATDGGERFRVRVSSSPGGEQRLADAEEVTLPPELRRRLRRLEKRQFRLPEMIALGEDLAELLFPPTVRPFLTHSLERIEDDEGLRIRLKLDTYALADLPWEYAYVLPPDTPPDQKSTEGFLALNRRLSLVRYEVMGQAPGTLDPVGTGPLRLVALLASPDDPEYAELALDAERDNIREALKDVPGVGVEFYPDATVDTLEDALTGEAHVFHFGGHGRFDGDLGLTFGSVEGEGFIVLLDEDRRGMRFPADRLARNLTGRGVRLAVLGACEAGRRDQMNAWTGVVPALTRASIPAVVGMQYTVRDRSAIAFNRRLYRALADGQPIDAAVTDGRLAIFNRSSDDERDWGVPVLYLRADEGVLFPRPQVVEEENTWDDVLERSRGQTERFLREARGTPQRPGPFISEVYTHRATAEAELNAFLDSDASALIVLGDSGVGKTNLLCQWTLELLEAGHSAFFYDCGGSIGLDIEREIARDLSVEGSEDSLVALERVGELAGQAGQQFVLIFDAVNEFRSSDHVGPGALLKRIDALAGRLPERNVRVVLGCSMPAWRHLERVEATDLFWSRYFQPIQPGSGEPLLQLNIFTPQEFGTAYDRYRAYFHLRSTLAEVPAGLRERLRTPLLLRMTAEAYQDRDEPIVHEALAMGIIRRYYEDRVRRRKDRLFVDDLAAEMLRQRRSTLAVDDLARHERLKTEILSDDPDSSYYQLLDRDILTETSGDLLLGDVVKFTYARVGAYALARHLLRQPSPNGDLVSTLVREAREFPMAWDAALTLLLVRKDPDAFARLARSMDVELRELAVEGLVELHADKPDTAGDLIKQLLQTDSEEARRTGLKAAYTIGPGARDVFLWAATKGSPALRRAAKDALYLIWRTDPEFTYSLLNELVERIGLGNLPDLRNILEFIIDLSITIYINHCEREDIVQQTTDLWYEILKNRLHLDLLNTGILGPAFEKLVFQAVARAFSRQLLDTALFTDLAPAERFFDLPAEERETFKRVVPLVDPQADLESAQDDMAALLRSDMVLFNYLAALVLAIHGYHDFEATEPLLRRLFDELEVNGRLWEILGFAVLLPGTPPGWVGLLETFTRRLIEQHPAIFYGEEQGVLAQFDILLVPLGLAYGKRGPSMPHFEALIQEGLSRGDRRQVARCLAGLGPVGFYYPDAVFHTLRAAIPDFTDPDLQAALVPPLATMRTLHFDAVDVFLQQIGADEAFQRSISAAADVELVQRHIYTLGLHNNAVHQALFYPKMRRHILIGGLNALADARSPQDFIATYTPIPIRMVREAGFRLSEWTLPE